MSAPDLARLLAVIDDWEPDVVSAGALAGDARAVHGASEARLPVASLTKPMTAWGVLIASTRGLVHLDEPVTIDGVASPDTTDTTDSSVTVRHLLAHAGGLPIERDGRPIEPGTRRVYSNWGYEVLGALVAERADEPFARFLQDEVFAPLGMNDTVLDGSPARAATSTLDDMMAFADELRRPTLIPSELHAEATSEAFEGLDGILPGFGRQRPNPWGLGVEVRGHKQPHWAGRRVDTSAFGHFGQSGSMLIVDRTRDLALVSLADRAFGRWAARRWPELIDAVVDSTDVA